MTTVPIDRLIERSCQRNPTAIAFRSKLNGHWQSTSYAELRSSYRQFAAGLTASGFKPGQHVAIVAAASWRWVAAYLAVLHCGGIVVPIDKELKASELKHILKDSDAGFLLTEQPYLEILQDLFADLPKLQRIVLLDDTSIAAESSSERPFHELSAAWNRLIQEHALSEAQIEAIESLANQAFKQLCPSPQRTDTSSATPGWLAAGSRQLPTWIRKGRLQTWSDLLKPDEPPSSLSQTDQVAVILYTSGTTGQAKGAMLSHANLAFNIAAGIEHLGLQRGITTLSFLPINHVFEQVCGILLPLSIGGTVSFAESLKKIGENLVEVQPTFLLGVPAVYRLLLDRIMKNIQAKPLTRLLFKFPLTRPLIQAQIRRKVGPGTTFISGGAALDPAIAAGFTKLGLMLFQGYGITETSPIIAAESPHSRQPGSVGQPMPGVKVRLDQPNPDGIGEILVKGPNVMLGYYKNQAATDAAIIDGWYRTGDLGRFDRQGNLFICGRVKNLIVTANGKNVYPEEVENELLKSPYIAEVMVYGHKTTPSTEEVYAIIYPDQEVLDARNRGKKLQQQDIESLLRQEVLTLGKNLADYKRVKKFTLREDEFPKTTTRKIKRFVVEPDIPTDG